MPQKRSNEDDSHLSGSEKLPCRDARSNDDQISLERTSLEPTCPTISENAHPNLENRSSQISDLSAASPPKQVIGDYFPISHIDVNHDPPYRPLSIYYDLESESIASTIDKMGTNSDVPCKIFNFATEFEEFTSNDLIKQACTILPYMPERGELTDGIQTNHDTHSITFFRGGHVDDSEPGDENIWSAIISKSTRNLIQRSGKRGSKMRDHIDRSEFINRFRGIKQSCLFTLRNELEPHIIEQNHLRSVIHGLTDAPLPQITKATPSTQHIKQSIKDWSTQRPDVYSPSGIHIFTIVQDSGSSVDRQTDKELSRSISIEDWLSSRGGGSKESPGFHQLDIANTLGLALQLGTSFIQSDSVTANSWKGSESSKSVMVRQRSNRGEETKRFSEVQIGDGLFNDTD